MSLEKDYPGPKKEVGFPYLFPAWILIDLVNLIDTGLNA